MERRLYAVIMTPGHGRFLILGLLLTIHIEAWSQPWFHVKASMLLGLIASHVAMGKWRNACRRPYHSFAKKFSSRRQRDSNMPLMIGIVLITIVKPFKVVRLISVGFRRSRKQSLFDRSICFE